MASSKKVVAYKTKMLDWQKRGLQQTASGYGKKLTSSQVAVMEDGKERRVYVTQYSNSGTSYIIIDKKEYVVSGYAPEVARPWRE